MTELASLLSCAEEKWFNDDLKSNWETLEKDLRHMHGYREAVFLPLPNWNKSLQQKQIGIFFFPSAAQVRVGNRRRNCTNSREKYLALYILDLRKNRKIVHRLLRFWWNSIKTTFFDSSSLPWGVTESCPKTRRALDAAHSLSTSLTQTWAGQWKMLTNLGGCQCLVFPSQSCWLGAVGAAVMWQHVGTLETGSFKL